MRKSICGVLVSLISLSLCVAAEQSITAKDAKDHIGETAVVCGVVASAHFAQSSKGQPTFINLDEAYPNQIFTILIWGSDRSKFGAPEQVYSGRKICVSGPIKLFRGVPETVAYDPKQVRVMP